MASLGEIAYRVRSKNAGPFQLTIDVFCGNARAYEQIVAALSTARVAGLLSQPEQVVRRFELPDLHVVKFSLPRPEVQGSRFDRDMHGAQFAHLLAETEIEAP